jgi:hypothetical protein
MRRSLCTAAIAYGCGYPILDGYRPALVDLPLQAFHRQVDLAAEEGGRAFVSLNRAREVYVKAYLARAEKQLRPQLAPAVDLP